MRGFRGLLLSLIVLVSLWSWPVSSFAEDQADFGSRFSPYEPVYFSVGWRDKVNARFQLSFKYRFINPDAKFETKGRFVEDLYVGYTQTSFWDLESESAPFHDTSYRPSLFHHRVLKVATPGGGAAFSYTAGFEHESNGKSEEFSRSINVFFAQPSWTWGAEDAYRFGVAPKVYVYLGDLTDNPDIADYRGYLDLHLSCGKMDSWFFKVMLRSGTKKNFSSILLDVSYPTYRLFRGAVYAFLHFQYFNGWGESILDYNQKRPAQYRIGILLTR